MITTVISFVSPKGGSGKTTTTLSLAKLLVELDYRVLVVDADAATNGATLFLLDAVLEMDLPSVRPVGVFEEDTDQPDRFNTVLVQEGFEFCPAAFRLTDTVASACDHVRSRLQAIVEKARHSGEFDFVLIDNEAGVEEAAVASSAISDRVVIVSEFDPVSAQGIERLKRLQGESFPEGRTWELFNKVLPEFAEAISDRLVIRHTLPPIPWSSAVIRAYVSGELPVDTLHPTEFTIALASAAEIVIGRRTKSRFTEWREDIAQKYEEGLQAQLEVIESELVADRSSERVAYSWRWVSVVAVAAAIFLVLVSLALLLSSAISVAQSVVTTGTTVVLVSVLERSLPRWRQRVSSVDAERGALNARAAELRMVLSQAEASRSTTPD